LGTRIWPKFKSKKNLTKNKTILYQWVSRALRGQYTVKKADNELTTSVLLKYDAAYLIGIGERAPSDH